jgi:putative Mn2+ efflux pump MntP
MMNIVIISQVILLGIALSMDAFAVSVSEGLNITDLNKKKSLFIALVFGAMQALMPLIGFFLIELVNFIGGKASGEQFGIIASNVVAWVSFTLLLLIGAKMLFESIKSLKNEEEVNDKKSFKIKEILVYGIATSIDALAAGVSMHAGISDSTTIWLHVSIIFSLTFVLSLIGLFLAKTITKLLKGKYSLSGILGGVILICLAIWVILSHYFGF